MAYGKSSKPMKKAKKGSKGPKVPMRPFPWGDPGKSPKGNKPS